MQYFLSIPLITSIVPFVYGNNKMLIYSCGFLQLCFVPLFILEVGRINSKAVSPSKCPALIPRSVSEELCAYVPPLHIADRRCTGRWRESCLCVWTNWNGRLSFLWNGLEMLSVSICTVNCISEQMLMICVKKPAYVSLFCGKITKRCVQPTRKVLAVPYWLLLSRGCPCKGFRWPEITLGPLEWLYVKKVDVRQYFVTSMMSWEL